jgi:hypothetical protein
MSNVFKKLNFLNLRLQDQFDNGYSTVSRWNDAVLDFLTTREDRGDIMAVCISGLRTGQNNGSSTYQNDARPVTINGKTHLAIKIRRKGIEGSIRPDPMKQANDVGQSEFLIGMHEEAISDKPIDNVSSVPAGTEVKCYFADGREFGLSQSTLFFRADQVGGSYINFLASPLKALADTVSDVFSNTQKPTFLGESLPPDGTNGRLFPKDLTDIGQGKKMKEPAATAYKQMAQAAKRDGITWKINEAYRTIETQLAYYKDPPEGLGKYNKKYIVNGKEYLGKAGTPGKSKHGYGLAVDISVASNQKAYEWLVANASKYKFFTIKNEPWHWEYRG